MLSDHPAFQIFLISAISIFYAQDILKLKHELDIKDDLLIRHASAMIEWSKKLAGEKKTTL